MTDTPALRKARGAFFTPEPLARFLTRWAIRSADDRVYEPSCGEAVFLTEAVRALSDHGADRIGPDQLAGVDLHGASVDAARRAVADLGADAALAAADFFDVDPEPVWTAVVGNPPYVRYQDFAGSARAKARRAALAAGVSLTALASSWAAFTVHAARLVAPDGRLGLVLPAELLSTNYAAEVRSFLLRRFASVRLVLFTERVFPGVQEEVLLLLAEGSGGTDAIHLHQTRNADTLAAAADLSWAVADLAAAERWVSALLASSTVDVYARLTGGPGFTTLETWGDTTLGAVTGNNRWFTLTVDRVRELELTDVDLIRISPPGSKHLRGLTLTDRAWQDLAADGRRVYLFRPAGEPSRAGWRYIQQGEDAGINEAYKCRVRKPWWRVPLPTTPDLFVTYMNADTPRLCTNRAQLAALNSVHGLTLHPGRRRLGADLLPIATLNSVTLLGAEMVGRSYGGGMLKIEPREADRLPVPSPALLEEAANDLRALRPQLARHLRSADILSAARLVDRVFLRAHLGVTTDEMNRLRDGRDLFHTRRVTRGKR